MANRVLTARRVDFLYVCVRSFSFENYIQHICTNGDFFYFLMGNTDPALYSWIVLHHTTDTLVAKKVRNEKHEKVSGHRGEKISIFQSHMQSAVSQSGFPLGHFTDFTCSFIN